MSNEVSFWVASVETAHTQSTAFGATPEQALTAFVELWIDRHCPASDADATYPWELKDGISIGKAVLGQGYMLSNHDQFWYQESVRGDDPRLEATWAHLAHRYGVFPTSVEDTSARLRQAFDYLKAAVETDRADFGKEQPLVERAMREMASLVAEDPETVEPQVLVQAADNLRTSFDALRTIAVMESDPKTREHRRDHARRYHEMSYDLTRFSNAIAGMRAESPSP